MSTTYKGVNRTLADTPTGQNILSPGLFAGKLRVMIDTYAMKSGTDEVTGQNVSMGGLLPIGAKIVEVILHSEVLSSGAVAVSVGDDGSATRYLSSVACGTGAAQTSKMLAAAIAGRAYTITAATNQIILTFTTVNATVVEAAKIVLIVLYVVE